MSGIYRPSGLVQLHVRLTDGVGDVPSEALAVLRGQVAPGAATDLAAFASPIDGLSVITAVQPASVTLLKNTHRAADKLALTIQAADLPIPTRLIRSIGVLAFLGTVDADAYAAGLSANARGSGVNTALLRPSRDNLRFIGFMDDIDEDTDGGMLSMESRDYTGILLDTPVAVAVFEIDINAPLDDVIVAILRTVPGGAADGIRVRRESTVEYDDQAGTYRMRLGDLPNVAKTFPAVTKRRRGKQFRLPASLAGSELSYWDLITDICVAAGFVPIIDLDTLRLTTPRTLLGRTRAGGFERVVTGPGGAERLTTRRMVHGSNIDKLRFSRKFGRVSVPGVEVRSLVPGRAEPLVVRWPPPKRDRSGKVLPSGRGQVDQTQTLLLRGIEDPRQLIQIAEGLYEELGRSEYGGRLETYDLASFGGGNEDPDLLSLASGEPLEVVARNRGITQTLSDYLSRLRSPVEMREALVKAGWAPRVAQGVVNLYVSSQGLNTVFRVQEARQHWQLSGDSPSVRIGVTFGTYLEPLHAPALPLPDSVIDVPDQQRTQVV